MSRKKREKRESRSERVSHGIRRSPENKGLTTSRRNALKYTLFTLLGGGGAVAAIYYATRTPDIDAFDESGESKTVFDETNGNGSKNIKCYPQLHSGPELVLFARRDPTVITNFVAYHRGLFKKLLEHHSQNPKTIFCLEGCNPFMQQRLLSRQDIVADIQDASNNVQNNPARAVRDIQRSVNTKSTREAVLDLQRCEASLSFLVRQKNDRSNIYGTEPDQDKFEMLGDYLPREIAALQAIEAKGGLTDAVLADAAKRWNARERDEIITRHTHIRDLLRAKLSPGGTACVVIGAGHLRSTSQKQKLLEINLEDYLLQIADARVRVTQLSHLTKLQQQASASGKSVEKFTPELIRKILQQAKE